MDGAPRRVLAGRYRLEGRLGQGGMGTVWRAVDLLLDRSVAVKEVLVDAGSGHAERAERRERVLREARTAARLTHPRIVVVHDVVEEDGRPWIVMELVEGRSLAEALHEEGPLSPRDAARVGAELAAALAAAHAGGVLHRDVKPGNVLLEAGTGRVVLTDFGIARPVDGTTLTSTGQLVGSLEYMAPERMSGGREEDPASDLWSLGVLLWAAVTGDASPFRRNSVAAVLHAVALQPLVLPETAGELMPLLARLLDRDTTARPDAAEAERELRAVAEERGSGARAGAAAAARPAPAPPETPPAGPPATEQSGPGLRGPAGPRRRRRGLTVVLAAAGALALAGAGAGAVLMTEGRGGGHLPASTTPASRTAASPTVTAPAPASASPFPSASPSASASTGFHQVEDPRGFALDVPDGFTRSDEPPRVFYYSAGRRFRLGIMTKNPAPADGPLAEMRAEAAAADGPHGAYPGYRGGTVTATEHRGDPAALWEFTWNGDGDGPRHTLDLSWSHGGTQYDVWVSAPLAQADAGRRYYTAAERSFTPG
ncbi:hypothetical protein BIV57_16360 [Mangrovactinospora gilvigrisea]|uniref:non-specific serine/threonine protein kinase n=1 Tax=Mangrovactinospora gilvigrisea TaxID=1428644 RepID=A0A1J7C9W1_9ACTN|nr:hypothetical protein BIV57_16360 [Mangrovactinospora gilvigrisea]